MPATTDQALRAANATYQSLSRSSRATRADRLRARLRYEDVRLSRAVDALSQINATRDRLLAELDSAE